MYITCCTNIAGNSKNFEISIQWDLKYWLLKLPTAKITNFIELIDIILPTASKVKIRLLALYILGTKPDKIKTVLTLSACS
jgi:hypothetical protein